MACVSAGEKKKVVCEPGLVLESAFLLEWFSRQ